MKIDLHTHSNRSDGTDTPAELVQNAARAGLDVVALTDHDATAGWDEAVEAGHRLGVRVVRGIEISTMLDGVSVHLLGYEFDPTDAALVAELMRVRAGRDDRLPQMLERLADHGMEVTLEEVEAHATGAAAIGRPHIADAMVARGYIAHRDEAFDGWLNTGGKAHVERYSAPLFDAVRLLKAAGGAAVVAHPWSRESRRVLTSSVIGDLQQAGLDGIEVDHVDHDDASRIELRAIAGQFSLVATGSSDYHGTGKGPAFHLGCNTTAPEEFEELTTRWR